MRKRLQDLSRDDWNTLFPIELVDHNPDWKNIFEKEKRKILSEVGKDIVLRIEHFGSSAIPAIKSKPYIDILIEIPNDLLFDDRVIVKFEAVGYTHFKVPERDNIDAYMSFGKGYNLEGKKEQIFHIHMCPKDNYMWNQIAFRDYLNENHAKAKEYEALKLKLAAKHKNDRGAYVLGKTNFVKETVEMIAEMNSSKGDKE
ncbi:MAG: GrpB family protein [Cyclobacteriaceae bacterium]